MSPIQSFPRAAYSRALYGLNVAILAPAAPAAPGARAKRGFRSLNGNVGDRISVLERVP
jgi:hypothetical protein